MHALRTSSRLVCLVLAWFALTIGVAGASPFVQPKTMALVCSADGGIKLVVTDGADDGAQDASRHTLDCALCLPAPLPPAAQPSTLAAQLPLAHVLQSVPAAHDASWPGAPLPARGPPLRT